MQATVTVDTKSFDAVLKEYMRYTKRTAAEVANTACYYAARNAVLLTQHSEGEEIRRELGRRVTVDAVSKKGKAIKRKENQFTLSNNKTQIPRVFLIINAQRRFSGKPPLAGKELAEVAMRMINARVRAVNFIRSGWLPGIKLLGRFAVKGTIVDYGKLKERGKPTGGGTPAKPNLTTALAVMFNDVIGSHGKASSVVENIKNKGAQAGLDKEMQSKQEYIDRKLQEDLNKTFPPK